MRVTVIAPALNEIDSIDRLLDSLLAQTRQPDEIIIADGGSTDGTRERLDERAADEPRLTVVDGPGGISENRNAAIGAAQDGVIACTDAGCAPEPDWLERLVEPFEDDSLWVAGVSLPEGRSTLRATYALALMPAPNEIDPRGFVPGGASQAFTKSAWQRVRGFPEGMPAGEDTVFGRRMRAAGLVPAFTPEAIVRWSGPASFAEMLRKAHRWGKADGHSGSGSRQYLKLTVLYWAPLAAALVLAALGWWLAALAVLVLYPAAGLNRTIKKMSWIKGPLKWLSLPVAHVAKMLLQTFGWLQGFLTRPGRAPLSDYLKRAILRTVAQAKRWIRPFIPERVMSQLRKPTALNRSQAGVTVYVDDLGEARRWLQATPDTYRAALIESVAGSEEGDEFPSVADPQWSGERLPVARWILTGTDSEVVLIAEAEPPRVDLGRFNEPDLGVLAVIARPSAWDVVAHDDPTVVAALARNAGLRIGLLPQQAVRQRTGPPPIDAAGSVVVLGTVPIYDIGGGSRGAQITQEMLARGYHVVHTYLYEAAETVDLGLRFVHPDLEHLRLEEFDAGAFVERLRSEDRVAILELPHPAFLPAVQTLREHGFRIVYDLMDDWSDPALGGWGYAEWAEDGVAVASDLLIASAPSLVKRLEEFTGREVVEIPNAVNTRLFRPAQLPAPGDIPTGDGPVFEYHGSLYGDWFDWSALEAVAEEFPAARILIIGDEKQHPPMPGNVHFLGLKAQVDLPAYLSHTDVALIPFEVSETTHAVSPLKVFEYMAMGVPVAATPLQPLLGLDGVYTDENLVQAVYAALQGSPPDPDRVRIEHGWGERMGRLFNALGLQLRQAEAARPVSVVRRPVIRYPEDERLIT